MAEMTEIAGAAGSARDVKVIGLVGAAHFVSHLYMLVLPPLFVFIKADYGVSYAALGLAIAAFSSASVLLQTPAGFLVDRLSARGLLIAGLALGGAGMALAGLVHTYWALVAGFAIAGVANTVYHPADYAIMSHAVSVKRIGQAYSIHTFLGMLGQAVAPAAMLFLAAFWGWHGALLGAAILAFSVASLLLVQKSALRDESQIRQGARFRPGKISWRILLSPPILLNFFFFALLAMTTSGMYGFSIVGLSALYGTKIAVANFALTAYLVLNAAGVLTGGVIADRFKHPTRIVTIGLGSSGCVIAIIALVGFGPAWLIALMGLAGFLSGLIMPSRDIIVREVTPPGAFGTVFGFVSTGFSVAGVVAPLLFGWLMDLGEPRLVFLIIAGFTGATLLLVQSKRAA